MRIAGLSLRDFRGYASAEVELGEGVTVVCGPNGAGKTNLLEAVYFGCTGRSCRTSNEREVVRFGAGASRVEVSVEGEDGPHHLSVGFAPGQPKRMKADGAPVERMVDVAQRPLVSVFLPDRLELVKGAPALRRAHLDQFVAALWPARSVARRAYAQALAQRNALIARIRAGRAGRGTLETWDRRLAEVGIELMADRARAVDALRGSFSGLADRLGLEGEVEISYRPRSRASDAQALAAELQERVDGDLERGFTGHGPHRDDMVTLREGRDLRTYGSQGQQRLGLLALLLAEREALTAARSSPPVMLLDDVMSELDGVRRQALVELLSAGSGQAVITTTDAEHVPGSGATGFRRLEIAPGPVVHAVVPEALAA